jgi:hypothetical protein
MKYLCNMFFATIASLLLMNITHAELLVVKKDDKGHYATVDQHDVHQHQIAKVLLNYQWPMITTNAQLHEQLTPEEQDELLSSGPEHAYAEERLIRKKIQEIDARYDVVFIPTSLYEVLVLNEVLICCDPIINHKYFNQNWYNDRYSHMDMIHKRYYPDSFFDYNNKIVYSLFEKYPDLATVVNADLLADEIEMRSHEIPAVVMNSQQERGFLEKTICKEETSSLYPYTGRSIASDKLLARTMALEYQARKQNKALLFRTNEILSVPVDESLQQADHTYLPILASTLRGDDKENDYFSYSISFGNSLFAGHLHDSGACVYSLARGRDATYALSLDKKDYVRKGGLSDLFLISPASTLQGLSGRGEWFHSRAKAVVLPKNNKNNDEEFFLIKGLGVYIKPDSPVVTTTKDHLEHAQKFSDYVAQNVQVLRSRQDLYLRPNECLSQEQLQENQREIARYYGAMKIMQDKKKTEEGTKKSWLW